MAEICGFTFYFYLLLEDFCHGYNKIPVLKIHKEYPPANRNAYWRQLANEMLGVSKKRRPKQSITEREFHQICSKATGAKAGCDSASHWSTRLHFLMLRLRGARRLFSHPCQGEWVAGSSDLEWSMASMRIIPELSYDLHMCTSVHLVTCVEMHVHTHKQNYKIHKLEKTSHPSLQIETWDDFYWCIFF